MKKTFNIYLALLTISLAFLSIRCNDSKFAGGSSNVDPSDADGKNGGKSNLNPDGTPKDKIESDIDGSGGPGGSPGGSPGGKPPEKISKDCVDGDQVKFKFAEEIQSCIDAGNLYHFESGKCTTMEKTSFKCGFAELISEIKKLKATSHLVPAIEKIRDEGGKMVGCGQAADNKIIVGQMWVAPKVKKADCSYSGGNTSILTICFDSTGQFKLPKTDQEKQQFVLNCMNAN